MIIKTYQNYIIKSYLKNIVLVSVVFLCLVFFLNIMGEIKFFENFNVGIYYPTLLTLLNSPSVLFEIFPFVFLIGTQLFFINLFEKDELIIFKNYGLDNFKIIKILIIVSLIAGIFISTLFYTFSSNMKHSYLSFKNKFTNDNKYLAVINENGLWIKDELMGKINIINSEKFQENILRDISINVLEKNFELIQTIIVEKANIEKNLWKLEGVTIFEKDGSKKYYKEYNFETNFNREKIDNLFSNLSSLNYFELVNLNKDYKKLGFSTLEIKSHLHRLYSFPTYLMIMTIIGAILMFNVKYKKSKVFNIIVGILFSVVIYYINYLLNLMGSNEKIPIIFTSWFIQLILVLICILGLVKINEK